MAQKIIPKHITHAAEMIISRPGNAEKPFLIFDADNALLKVKELQGACGKYFPNFKIAISVKSCSLGLFCKVMADEGVNAEVCSIDEFQLAISAGFSKDRIIFDGPFKNNEDLTIAVQEQIMINIDSCNELNRLSEIVEKNQIKYGVGVRLSHFYDEENRSRFGVTEEEYINDILPLLLNSNNLYLKGFHLHVGSNLRSPNKIIDALKEWLPFLVKYMPQSGFLDLGSGFPADSFSSEPNIEICKPEVFFHSIAKTISDYDPLLLEKWNFLFEPGRYLSEDNGYMVGKAFGHKHRYSSQVVQTNLGINWIPSIRNWHHSLTIIGNSEDYVCKEAQILAGFNCFENDCLFPKGYYDLKEGQNFIIRGCGSYDLQTANDWTRRKPPVYVWLNERLLSARISSSCLSGSYYDLLYKKERLCIEDNIFLESPSSQYSSALYKVINSNREHFSKFMAWPRFVNHETDTANFLDSCLLTHQKGDGKTYIILFDNNPVGLLSFNSLDKGNKTAYIGYWLDSRVQGNGIITRTIKFLTEHYASCGLVQRFVIKCSTNNSKSNAVAKRCGFEYEGMLKQAEYLNGIFHDQNIYGLIIK